ncbi:hypothetical protein J437_LFUL000803 [Ladona fulva]|uniref:CAP-Gly domain-containing protein n=1 Tax=Ladona fulva TaxID=123851 RepID=A0A8K0KYJ0_LADFU|nr:hypothetical protein J437_LFUL000803 [Ladona fulva]
MLNSVPPGESRIPVFRSGIPLAFSGARCRTQLPTRPVRPTALAGLTATRPSPPAVTPSPESPTDSISASRLGCEVLVGGSKPGVLRYFGTLPFDNGLWCGVELHQPEGLNDGSVRGVRLFNCRPLHGVVAPVGKVKLLPGRLEVTVDEEEDGSTPREVAEEEWSGEEEEETPPAELRGGAAACPRTPNIEKESIEEEEDRCPALSPASLPTPHSLRTLDWTRPDHGGCPKEEEGSPAKKRSLRSDSVSSICELTVPAASSTPTSAEKARCSRRNHQSSGAKLEDACACGLGVSKQSSFELDESLGILTPDQMMDFTLEAYGRTPSGEELRVPAEEVRMEVESKDVRDEDPAPLVSDNTPSAATAAPLSRPAQVAPCFVASVTSITSIDPGYQGDGEWSRPASRADNSPSAPSGGNGGLSVDVLKIKFETMTDSDFYSDTGACGTESDADHEEVAGREGAMAPGDRRAQVIDGTLYGGVGGQQGAGGIFGGGHQQPPPRCFAAVMTSSTATTTEEMESSGVFSDLERRTDSSSHGGPPSVSNGGGDSNTEGFIPQRNSSGPFPRPSSAQGITSSAAESDVPQSPLEELPEDPKDVTLVMTDLTRALTPERVEVEQCDSMESTAASTQMDVTLPEEVVDETFIAITSEENPEVTRGLESHEPTPLQTPTVASTTTPASRPSSVNKKESPETPRSRPKTTPTPPKKYKMPKRNVASKIKAMIEAKEEGNKEEVENRRQVRGQTPKKGRWDAIMSKIAEGKAEQRTSRPRLREVKSRVLASIASPQANTSVGAPTDENEPPTRAKKPFASNVTRTRRAET